MNSQTFFQCIIKIPFSEQSNIHFSEQSNIPFSEQYNSSFSINNQTVIQFTVNQFLPFWNHHMYLTFFYNQHSSVTLRLTNILNCLVRVVNKIVLTYLLCLLFNSSFYKTKSTSYLLCLMSNSSFYGTKSTSWVYTIMISLLFLWMTSKQ